jgi:hypothetical protein
MNIKPFVFYTFLSLLLLSPCLIHAQDRGQKLSTKEVKALIDSLTRVLNKQYIYPDKAELMVSDLKKNYKSGVYYNIKDRTDLGMQLHKDVQLAFHDGHLSVAYDPQLAADLAASIPDTANNRREYEKNLLEARENNFAYKRAEILPGNIGYVRWDGFYEFVDEALPTVNGAFRFVGNCKALIIDMRNNGGGSPDMVLQTQSYFFNERTHMNDIIGRNNDTVRRWADPSKTDFKLNMPVYILTSHGTFSAAEDFTYGLQCAKRATVVGDTTGGGAHPTRPFALGLGFVAFIPTHRSVNTATNTDWEGTGVRPDVAVPSDQALLKAQALIFTQRLLKATNGQEKKKLQWNLTSIDNRALLAKQIQTDAIKISGEELLKYCGEYNAADPNIPLPTVFIIANGDHIFRHTSYGAEDMRLIPISANKFAYGDESGRTIEFVANSDGVTGMILSKQDGVFTLNKKK